MAKKSEIIQLFKKQRDKIEYLSFEHKDVWIAQTLDLIRNHVSPKSEYLKSFNPTLLFFDVYSFEKDKKQVYEIIDNCISTINTLFSEPEHQIKGNFISRMSEGWAIFWAGLVLLTWGGICFGCGQFFTQNKIDAEKISKQNKIDSLIRVTHTQSLIINSNKASQNDTTKSINNKSRK